MRGPYDDMIDLPRHVSSHHPQMPMEERAAQFSPFAALTGYGDVIRETARLTETRPELSDSSQEALKRKLDLLAKNIARRPEVTVTYFRQDDRKEGGACVTAAGRLKRIDETEHVIRLEDGRSVSIQDILEIESDEINVLKGEDFL